MTDQTDLAGRSREWYDGYNAAMRDYDKRQSVRVTGDAGLREALVAALEMVDLTAAQLRAALATEEK